MTAAQLALIFQPLKIGPIVYTVIRKTTQGNNGLIHFERCIIWLRKTLCYDKLVVTLWHEVIHAMDDDINLGLTEEQTDRLAHMMVDFLRKNPHMGQL